MPTRAQSKQRSANLQVQWRALKASGRTIIEIAAATGYSKQRVQQLTQPLPGERICGTCCQPLQPEAKLPKKRK